MRMEKQSPIIFVTKFRDDPAIKGDNDNDIPIIRYADVLLMYAKAYNEIGYQATGEAFTYLNQILTGLVWKTLRQRKFLTNKNLD